jgi:aerobic-type carbon monoxide dehydrogenase small subunit (CoxS/CutS family)
MKIVFTLNGTVREIEAEGTERVLDLIREDMGLTGAREGCGSGECGACTVLVDGQSRLACLMKAVQLEGRSVVTIEGLREDSRFTPLLEAFASSEAVQCGYCTPGMVLAAVDLLNRDPDPSEEEVLTALSGNICRCPGYRSIAAAVLEGARRMRETAPCRS